MLASVIWWVETMNDGMCVTIGSGDLLIVAMPTHNTFILITLSIAFSLYHHYCCHTIIFDHSSMSCVNVWSECLLPILAAVPQHLHSHFSLTLVYLLPFPCALFAP